MTDWNPDSEDPHPSNIRNIVENRLKYAAISNNTPMGDVRTHSGRPGGDTANFHSWVDIGKFSNSDVGVVIVTNVIFGFRKTECAS